MELSSQFSEEQSKVIEAIVNDADRSDLLWRDSTILKIRECLQKKFALNPQERRILYWVDRNNNQTYFGSFEHWGKAIVLFLPSPEYKDYLAFVNISFNEEKRSLMLSAYGFTTARNEFDNAFFTLGLNQPGDENPPLPIRCVFHVVDANGEDFLKIQYDQAILLYHWFLKIHALNN